MINANFHFYFFIELSVFYTGDGWIAGKEHIWVQDALTLTVEMLLRVGLNTNLEKTKALVCNPGYMWVKWSEAAYKRRDTREGVTLRDRK